MKLALQYEMQRPSLDDHKVLTETMEQCILADEVGFDYLWFVEHHFLTGFSASPCPDLVYAALSQRTKQIQTRTRRRDPAVPSPEPCCRARGHA